MRRRFVLGLGKLFAQLCPSPSHRVESVGIASQCAVMLYNLEDDNPCIILAVV